MTCAAIVQDTRRASMGTPAKDLLPLDASTQRIGPTTISIDGRCALPAVRSAGQIESDRRDEYALVMSLRAEWTASMGIRRFRVLPMQVVILDFTCGWKIVLPCTDQIVLLVPRSIVRALCAGDPRLHGRVLRSASGAMLSEHLLSLAKALPTLATHDARAVERALLNLVASAINGTARTCAAGRTPFIDTSLIAARARRHIEENLTDPELSVASLCDRLSLSKTDLSRAFGSLGRVAQHIRCRRLAIAREMIAESVVAPALADLAQMFCFKDAEAFAKAFARYFGYSPHAVSGESGHPETPPGFAEIVPSAATATNLSPARIHCAGRSIPTVASSTVIVSAGRRKVFGEQA